MHDSESKSYTFRNGDLSLIMLQMIRRTVKSKLMARTKITFVRSVGSQYILTRVLKTSELKNVNKL